ncbi:MAG: antitoxin [Solirubrobacteraceae bacterium]
MRTTVTLDPDVEAKLKQLMHERGCSFKVALNDSVRAGVADPSGFAGRYEQSSRPMRLRPGVDLDRALSLAGELEDAERLRKLRLRK